MPSLGLNEALLVVNRINTTEPISLYYQLEECFGCPLEPLRPLSDDADKYLVNTKYNVQLEMRRVSSGRVAGSTCKLNDLELNSLGQYRIDVSPAALAGAPADETGQLECKLKILDYGECLLCPFAILICFLFAMMATEQAVTKFWPKRAAPSRQVDLDQTLSADLENAKQKSDSSNHNNDDQTTVPKIGDQANELANPSSANQLSIEHDMVQDAKDTTVAFRGASASGERPPSADRARIDCLDVFRGLTLAGMIFVNYGGAGYAIWDHKPWDGITLADFVFPFFIFSMGASIAISIKALIKRHRVSFKVVVLKIFSRATILMLLGIFLNSKALNYERADALTGLRLTGVLQRFSISYLVVGLMYAIKLTLNKWTRAQSLSNLPYVSRLIGIMFELLTAINYTSIYVYVTFYYEYDANNVCPIGYVGPGGKTAGGQYSDCTGGAAAWLDRIVLGTGHLYDDHEVKQIFKTKVTHDPEGLLGYTTSIVLTLIGLQCGKILMGKESNRLKIQRLAKWSAGLTLSCSLVTVIPINKRLWSLTFILVAALAAFLIILAFYILIDIYSCKRSLLVRLLSSAGKNSIFLYVGHSLIHGLLPWWLPIADHTSHMQLLFRLIWSTAMWLLIAHYMAYKKLFIKI